MKNLRKLMAVLLALAVVLSVSAVAFAAGYDATKTASLRIVKYDDTDEVIVNSEVIGTYTGVKNAAIEAAFSGKLVDDVGFHYVKVADINVSADGQVLYKVADNSAFIALLGTVTPAKEETGFKYYALKALNEKLPNVEKNTLEDFAKTGTKMELTGKGGETGVTTATGLAQGLYLVVETSVPEQISATSIPFLVSLPLQNEDGWQYEVTAYPKNKVDEPTLEKTVSNKVDGEYTHTTTATIGDTVYYKVESELPAINSKATYLTEYTFEDTKPAGLTFSKDVKITVDGKEWATSNYAVAYEGDVMTITMTEAGLKDLSENYSEKVMVITYSCVLNEEADLGDIGNTNTVKLTYGRENGKDDLEDCSHVYTYGIELTKTFSDNKGDFSKVKFTVKNADGKYIALNDGKISLSDTKVELTPENGKILLKGLEAGIYTIVEEATDENYSKLTGEVTVEIKQTEGEQCPKCEEKLKIASASKTYNGETQALTMTADGNVANAIAPLTIVNNGIELPPTGAEGTWLLSIVGILAMAAAAFVIILVCRKKATAAN